MDTMNKLAKKMIFGLLCLCCALGADGQTLTDGQIAVQNLAVSKQEDKLFVAMDLDISALKQGSNREVLFTPSLTLKDDSLSLPAIRIAGRNRYYHHLRNASDTERLYRNGERNLIEYRVTVPYEKWMGRARLSATETTCGCCDAPLTSTTTPLSKLRLEKRVPTPFVPAYAYIRPKAEQKINRIEGSAYIDFPVNRTEIHPDYRRNPEELKKILSTIDAVKNDADSKIISISIKGYASPEGSYSNNIRLAKGRTETLKEYVRKQYVFPQSLFTTGFEPEDWEGLERFVTSSQLKNREGILALIHSDLDSDAKDRKIKATYPADYAYLLSEVYPGLRHSDYAVQYEVRAYTDLAEIRSLLKSQPQKLSLNEMYLVAQEMEPGSDEYNATFATAVRMFPDDPVANLNAANTALRLGDLKGAETYLGKAGDAPEAIYARGIHAALLKDYDAAQPLLKQALQKGVAQAEDALQQIERIRQEMAEDAE